MIKKYKLKKFRRINTGYTIIETMIAISLFLVVVMFGMGSLLNSSLIHKKSQDMRSIMDSLSFVMEDISRNLRTGYDYHCIDDGNLTAISLHNCTTGGSGISFKSSFGNQLVYAIFPDGSIQKSSDAGTDGTFITLTTPEIKIDSVSSSFSVFGALKQPDDFEQPFVTIRLSGTITSENNVVTPFSLQTSVSERLIDNSL